MKENLYRGNEKGDVIKTYRRVYEKRKNIRF